MVRTLMSLFMLSFLIACAEIEQDVQVSNGEVWTPRWISPAWARGLIRQIRAGNVHTISCWTEGGDADAALAIAQVLQSPNVRVKVVVQEGLSCVSAGAILWFAAHYRTAKGSVVLHSPMNRDGTLGTLNPDAIQVLVRAGATEKVQDKLRRGNPRELYVLDIYDIEQNSRSP